jgi:hypothetical protein
MLECKICGRQFVKNNIVSHLKNKHNITGSEYKEKYNSPVLIQSEETKQKLSKSSTNNNIYSVQYWTRKGYSEEDAKIHISELGKKNSIRSVEYWVRQGYTVIEAKNQVAQFQSHSGKKQKASKHRWISEGYSEEDAVNIATQFLKDKSIFHKEYWMNRHDMTEKEATEKIASIQSELSGRSTKFLGKTHTEKEKRKISNSVKKHIHSVGTDKWIEHFGNFDNGRSLLEDEVYQYVKTRVSDVRNNISIDGFVVDILIDTKVIEVFGDYWHANPMIYESTDIVRYPGNKQVIVQDKWDSDNLRLESLKKCGYDVLVIWEYEWRNNLNNTQQKILDFLNDN